MLERFGLIQFAGKDVTVLGPDLKVGDVAPDFAVQTQDWRVVNALEETAGKVRIIAALPSLETSVCDLETRRFNEAAAGLGEDIAIISISMDLPFTQKRWCGAAGIDQVSVFSDHLTGDFGLKYGCLLKEVRLLRRAVFVVNREGKLVYVDYMPALGDEPDYEAVLAAAKQAL